MPRRGLGICEPIGYVAQDADGKTVQVDWIDRETDMWEVAEELLQEHESIKRIALFDSQFTFVNALSRPSYLKREDDIIAEEDRQALLGKQRARDD